MNLNRHTTRLFAQLLIGLLLFTQWALAAHACESLTSSAVQAFAMQEGDDEMAGMDDCHDAANFNANACLAHCTQADQIGLDAPVHAIAPPSTVALLVEVPEPIQARALRTFNQHPALNTDPPLAIRFCSFLL
jgi:hypothetical protein